MMSGLRASRHHLREQWRDHPHGVAIDLLRLGMGIVWALDLIFILDPANQYFSSFSSVAQGYSSQSLGGAALPNYVAAHSLVFAWLIALVTAYLAVAFLFGLTTRLACIVGAASSVFFLWTQFLMTFMIPGGTDVGAHPLYLLIYLVLFVGGAGRYLAVDAFLWEGEGPRLKALVRWLFTPAPVPSHEAAGTSPEASPARRGFRRPFWVGSAAALVVGVVLVVAMLGVQEAQSTPSNPYPNLVDIVGTEYTILYPANATTGGFGPSQQSGCFGCHEFVSPGNITLEEEMLTNKGTSPETIDSMTVAAPFVLVKGPSLPMTVPAHGGMAMFLVTLQAPAAPGEYTLAITFTVS